MQITPDQLLAEAGEMALQIRLLDKQIAGLAAENAQLRAQLADAPDEAVAGTPPSAA